MRASYGTLQLLGIKPGGYPFTPKTAFFLLGEKCLGGCLFCPQSEGQEGKLSRVTWPEIDEDEAIDALPKTALDRICLQATKSGTSLDKVTEFIFKINQLTTAPVSVSMHIENEEQAEILFQSGADDISLALDTATEELSQKIKKTSLSPKIRLLKSIAKLHPFKVTTHLIMGLGETEQELVELARDLISSGINVSLFAFTPIPGTTLENLPQPEISRYRKVQAILAQIRKNNDHKIIYENGKIKDIGDTGNLEPSDFQNPGCIGCNRPYYNEKPGGVMYNFPNPPDIDKIKKELAK